MSTTPRSTRSRAGCRSRSARRVAQTHAIVHRVFVKWFGARIAGAGGIYRKLATALYALRPRGARRAQARTNLRRDTPAKKDKRQR